MPAELIDILEAKIRDLQQLIIPLSDMILMQIECKIGIIHKNVIKSRFKTFNNYIQLQNRIKYKEEIYTKPYELFKGEYR